MRMCARLGVRGRCSLFDLQTIVEWVGGWRDKRQLGRLYFEALPGACDPGLELGLGLHLSPGAPLQQKYPEGLSGAERRLLGNRVSDGSAAPPPTRIRLSAWDFFPPFCLQDPGDLRSSVPAVFRDASKDS